MHKLRGGMGRLLLVVSALALDAAPAAASMRFELDGAGAPEASGVVRMLLLTTGIALLPALLLTTTSFVRIAVVLSFLKNAMGTQTMPPTQVMMGLSLFLTVAIMAPVGKEFYAVGLEPYLAGKQDALTSFSRGSKPVRRFMLRQTRSTDLALFYEISHNPRPASADAVEMHLLLPAFVISELRTAFEMGFVVYLPFLLVDLVVASLLMAMGMVMVPPTMLSLPIKIMLFVLADGWNVLCASLVESFQ